MFTHLNHNQECMQGYLELFKVDNVVDIVLQVTKLKKQSYSSRQPDQRALAYKSKKVKVEDFCLNKFHLATSFSNVFKCIVCKLHLSKSKTKTLKKEEWHLYVIDANDRRFGEFYICTVCEKNPRQISNDPIDEFETNISLKDKFSIHTVMHRNREDNNLDNINLPRSLQVSQDDQQRDYNEVTESDNNVNPDIALNALIENIPTQCTQHEEFVEESDNYINPDLALDALIQNLSESSRPSQDYPVMGGNGDCVEQLENDNQNSFDDQPVENTPRSIQVTQVYPNNNFEGSNQSTLAVSISEDYHSRIIVQK